MSATVWPVGDDPGTGGGSAFMPRVWSGGRNENGWSRYKAQWLVKTDDKRDGPDIVLQATGLPQPGDPWEFGNDARADVVCLPQRDAKRIEHENEPNLWWVVDTEFSNDAAYIGPIVSINGVKYTKEVCKDRFGRLLLSTSHELFQGPQAEFDFNRLQVKIEYPKKLSVNIPLWTKLTDTVNSAAMWGIPARCVKMEPYQIVEKWDEAFGKYFGVTFEFTIYILQDKDGAVISGFDRDVANIGTKALGGWSYPTSNIADAVWDTYGGDVNNPKDYFRYHDKAGNIARVHLKADGTPWDGATPPATDPPMRHVEHYPQSDFVALLEIPDPLYG